MKLSRKMRKLVAAEKRRAVEYTKMQQLFDGPLDRPLYSQRVPCEEYGASVDMERVLLQKVPAATAATAIARTLIDKLCEEAGAENFLRAAGIQVEEFGGLLVFKIGLTVAGEAHEGTISMRIENELEKLKAEGRI